MAEETPTEVLDAAQLARIPDAFRRLQLGTLLAQMVAPRRRTLATTPALTIDTNDVVFPRPVLAVICGSASVGGNDRPVVVIPEGAAAAAAAGGATGAHSAVATQDAQNRITRLTFSGAPTLPFFDVIEENTTAAERMAADLT